MYFKNYVYLCTRLEKMSTFKHRGVEQLVARQAHNLEVARSNPASATLKQPKRLLLFFSIVYKKVTRTKIGPRFFLWITHPC